MNTDISQQLQQQIQQSFAEATPLCIVGGNSKYFYGHAVSAETLAVSAHSGVLNYEPTELVITARAGTPLKIIEKLLNDNGQMLPFEPPAFGDNATIGGTIACNFSGPRRAYAGAARDFLLGCKLINGKGEMLSFGGEVMKNVAGYDVSRLMAGALGTLGVLLEVSLKVLPKTELETTQILQYSTAEALKKMHELSRTPLPVSASSYHDGHLHIRLSGTTNAVSAAINIIGGENMGSMKPGGQAGEHYWQQLKEQQLDFFSGDKPLWRLSLASDIDASKLKIGQDEKDYFYEWSGALRWLTSHIAGEKLQQALAKVDGHASLFRDKQSAAELTPSIFQPLSPGLLRIHKNLKQAFDPKNLLNPGKLYSEL